MQSWHPFWCPLHTQQSKTEKGMLRKEESSPNPTGRIDVFKAKAHTAHMLLSSLLIGPLILSE